jgi:N-acetylglucosamine-6-phosphate deacetylase
VFQQCARDVLSGDETVRRLDGNLANAAAAAQQRGAELYISPGWFDLQVNGFAGHDVNDPVQLPGAMRPLVGQLWAEGVACFLPTVITAHPEDIAACLRGIAAACRDDPDVDRAVAGIHLEGPYLSPRPQTHGAHPAEHLRTPDWDEFSRWQEAAEGRIRLVTLAPELPRAVDFIRRLVRAGVSVAIGHTEASTAELAAAAEAGAVLATHLGNGIAPRLPRHPNPIWDLLADDRLYASAIFDGQHLPSSVMRVLWRVKGAERLVLVSDAVALARMPPGRYVTRVGGQVELSSSGRLSLPGTEVLAGSTSSLRDCIENAVRVAGCSLAEAVRCVTVNPWHALGLAPPDTSTLFAWDSALGRLEVIATLFDGQAVVGPPEILLPERDRS